MISFCQKIVFFCEKIKSLKDVEFIWAISSTDYEKCPLSFKHEKDFTEFYRIARIPFLDENFQFSNKESHFL